MSFGFNFRSTAGYVTDGPNDQSVVSTNNAYPQVTTIGGESITWGYTAAPGIGYRNRNAGVDVRLAGSHIIQSVDGASLDFRVDLPSAGTYTVTLAAGDALVATAVELEILDDSTSRLIIPETQVNVSHLDATGVELTTADWPANNTSAPVEFSSGIAIIKVKSVATASNINHIHFEAVVAPSATGTLDSTLEDVTSAASGVITTTGSLSETLEDAISAASGTIESTTTGTLQRHFISAGVWSSKASSALLPNYAIGVPHPQNYFEYDPLTVAVADDPAEWPSAENSNYYYIDNTHGSATDTANDYGYPDKPRLSLANVDYTTTRKIVVVGGGANYTIGSFGRFHITMQATTANPAFIVGIGPSRPIFEKEIRLIGCSNVVIDNIECRRDKDAIVLHGSLYWEYITIRNSYFVGDLVSIGPASVISVGGDFNTNKAKYAVIYNCDARDFGENLSTSTENDIHAYRPTTNSKYIWIIGNVATNLGGDCVQVGEANTPVADRCEFVYIAKNDFSDTLENAVDIKSAYDVVISENVMYNFSRAGTAGGLDVVSPVVVHDNPDWVTIIANNIYECGGGIINTGGTNVHYVLNTIYDIAAPAAYNSEDAYSAGQAMHVRGSSSGYITNNTCHGYEHGMQIVGSAPMDIRNNIFSGRSRADGYEFIYNSSSDYTTTTVDNNNYYGPTYGNEFKRGADIENLTQWQAATGDEANSIITDPDFVNVGLDNYRLNGTSNAIDAGSVSGFYAAFEARYGIAIDVDVDGNPIPTDATIDIGAWQETV